jgi:hypothetical protein
MITMKIKSKITSNRPHADVLPTLNHNHNPRRNPERRMKDAKLKIANCKLGIAN